LDDVDLVFLPVAAGRFDAGDIPWVHSSAIVRRRDNFAAALVWEPPSNRLKNDE